MQHERSQFVLRTFLCTCFFVHVDEKLVKRLKEVLREKLGILQNLVVVSTAHRGPNEDVFVDQS